MTRLLRCLAAAPGVTLQDRGRPGWRGAGLSPGGAADPLALAEAAALLGRPPRGAGLEMAGSGGRFAVEGAAAVIALTGAAMRASIDGRPLAWSATHALHPGEVLEIGAAEGGAYGYLHLDGGLCPEPVLGSCARHVAAGLGPVVEAGAAMPLGLARDARPGLCLPPVPRFGGGVLRLVATAQSALFGVDALDRFAATPFRRGPRANRQGVRLEHDGAGFGTAAQLSVLSDAVLPGEVQIGGDGAATILLAEAQTTGGYPRIGAVLPCDLPVAAQAMAGQGLQFRFVTLDEGLAAERAFAAMLADLPRAVAPLVRDPRDIPDLLAYHLVSGAVDGGPAWDHGGDGR